MKNWETKARSACGGIVLMVVAVFLLIEPAIGAARRPMGFCGATGGGERRQLTGGVGSGSSEGVTVMFWNLENFFDFKDDGTGESDAEFSATGPRRWTKARFYRKCNAVAKTILWAGSVMAAGGDVGKGSRGGTSDETVLSLPDVVGMAEVENRFVLTQLVTKTALRKLDYRIVHFNSPDPRGIDCALLYRASRLILMSAKACRVSAPGLQTRDILLAQFLTAAGDSLAVLVNHHPSKYGGGETDWRREVAVARLRALGDSLAAAGWARAVAVGDFNDTPDNPLFGRLAPAFSLCRMTEPATAHDSRLEKQSSEGDAAGRAFSRNGSASPARGTSRRELAASPSEDANQRQQGTLSDGFGNGRSAAISSKDRPSLRGWGSIRFNGEWQLIDLCFVSPALAGAASFSVLEPPFLTERDAAHSGEKPLRTYSGPRYIGGVSDHRPILVRIMMPFFPAPVSLDDLVEQNTPGLQSAAHPAPSIWGVLVRKPPKMLSHEQIRLFCSDLAEKDAMLNKWH